MAPTSDKRMVGNARARDAFRDWVRQRASHDSYCNVVAFLFGPPGVGKTSTAHLVLRECGFDVEEINASDTRSEDQVSRTLFCTPFRTNLLTSRRTALVFDEIDGAAYDSHDGVTSALIKFIDYCQRSRDERKHPEPSPVVCICNDLPSPGLRALRDASFACRFYKLGGHDMMAIAKRVFQFKCLDPRTQERLVAQCNGDARQLINHIQVGLAGAAKDQECTPLDWADAALRARCDVKWVDRHGSDLSALLVHENYPRRCKKAAQPLDALAQLSLCLSDIDAMQRIENKVYDDDDDDPEECTDASFDNAMLLGLACSQWCAEMPPVARGSRSANLALSFPVFFAMRKSIASAWTQHVHKRDADEIRARASG